MNAEDTFTIALTWCKKHKNWWVTNCPDCMVDANEQDIKRAGIKEVIPYAEKFLAMAGHGDTTDGELYATYKKQWQSKLKEWGIE